MKKAFLILALAGSAIAQNARYDAPFPSITTIGAIPYLVANIPPNSPVLAVCNSPANAVPCTNFAATFTAGGLACPNGAQDTPQPATTSACQSTGDAQGNIGFWAAPGTYDYTVCVSITCYGPFTVRIGVGSGGGGGGGVVNPNNGSVGAVAQYNCAAGCVAISPDATLNDNGTVVTASGSGGVNIPNGPLSVGAPPGDSGYFHIVGNTANQGILANTFGFMGPPLLTFAGLALQWNGTVYPSASAPLLSCGAPVSGIAPCTFAAGLPATASTQIGDTLRFNVNGDSNWDPVNAAQQITVLSPTPNSAGGSGTPNVIGPFGSGANTGNNVCACGTVSDVSPTATAGWGTNYASAASASTNTLIGIRTGENGNNSQIGMLAFYRWTLKIKIGQTTNARWWMGLGTWRGSGGNGNNGLTILNSAGFASDSPNKTVVGFRFSSTTDNHWQAISAVAGGSQTTTDTGVMPDTANPHVYEMTTNSTGTAINYFIDGALVATITTNLPLPAQNQDSWGDFFWTGDNKNTANAVSATFYGGSLSPK